MSTRPPIMNSPEVIFLGVRSRVLAVSRTDGRTIWSTELAGGIGQGFVTVISDGSRIFAHTHGQLFCLDSANGQVLWTNELPGCGYGLASLCLPNAGAAPDAAAVQHVFAAQQQAAAH